MHGQVLKNFEQSVPTSLRIMWKWWQFCCILLSLWAMTSCQRSILDTPILVQFVRIFRNWGLGAFGRTGTDENYLQLARDAGKVQKVIPDHVPFPCNVTVGRSSEVPDSVHKLRPGDIDVIGAIGDSVTAGAGVFATSVFHILVDNRGVSATGGGQGTWRQYLTVPNILKEYNPNLIGYALGDSTVPNEASQLNVAETGAFSEDMPYMAEVLVTRIKRHPKIDLQKHWKFITIMIGGNDFCTDICWVSSPWTILEKHKEHMLQVLRTLRDNLPRTFVALIAPPHLGVLADSYKERLPLICYFTQNIECGCMVGLAYKRFRPMYDDIIRRWQEIDMEIATYPEFQRDDFVVVAQPFLMDLTVPLTSNGYFDTTYASADCFHSSQKTNAWYASSLWESLFQPVGAKMTHPSEHPPSETFFCPTMEKPYLATMLNSRKQND
ncbi:Phospholipase B1, membrane-associated [Ooceraea biroi]|uniref:Phospholipase B1, membrane-associated n=2 Tax=Ooceraea biroi TaxID=2015173 RepID=A0A026WZE0_OOCBI|nr:Phospholipase B1, membrane-associated [Ooceraea biroi]